MRAISVVDELLLQSCHLIKIRVFVFVCPFPVGVLATMFGIVG